jgi:predicted acylesterase/phospholipase RssA
MPHRRCRPSPATHLFALLAAATLAGCGGPPVYPNREAQQCDMENGHPSRQYRFENLGLGPGNTDQVFVCLTFSGGGTRAAALAYGVLDELAHTPLPSIDGTPRSLLDEVDVVSSVSGGSFTAMAYGLWGRDMLSNGFRDRFLYHNVTQDLVTHIIIQNLFILPSVFPDRIHVAADYCNQRLFEHKTYADLPTRRPFVVVNATSMTGERFEFTQEDFDVLGSDLDSVPLGHAVMASSAYPLLLSPMRLKYYRNALSNRTLHHILTDPQAPRTSPRRHAWARDLVADGASEHSLDEPNHRFIYLLDGGVSDNLGLSYVLGAFRSGPIREHIEASDAARRITRLVLIVVDAANKPAEVIESREIAPGLLEMGYKTATISVGTHSTTMLEIARYLLTENHERIRGLYDRYAGAMRASSAPATEAAPPETGYETYLVQVNLQNVADPARRRELQNLPTRLDLARDQVDRLIAEARNQLRSDQAFDRLKADLHNGQDRPARP